MYYLIHAFGKRNILLFYQVKHLILEKLDP